MHDIAERLRLAADEILATQNVGSGDLAELLEEAATVIEQQRDLGGPIVG